MKLLHVYTYGLIMLIAALPASSNYKLQSFGIGTGGTAGSNSSGSAQYTLEGISGETNANSLSSATYSAKSGFINTQQANVPKITLTNSTGSLYDKLKFVLDTQSNPSDTKYAIAISTDNFSTTKYIKQDNTVGETLTISDYQTYTAWGGAGGAFVTGLSASTTYYVKAKAMQGKFTETGYGPVSNAATVAGSSITFTLSPSSLDLGTLPAGSIVDSPSNITTTLDTSASQGGNVYITGANGGLKSNNASHTIASASVDLASPSPSEGFGARNVSITQTSGGPFTVVSPYDVAGTNVGIVDSTIRVIYSSGAAIVGGSATTILKAKASDITPAATDYTEIITIIAAAIF